MLKNAFLVTICLILSAVLGFIAQIVFVSTFGASGEMDAYFKILAIPSIITGISPIIFSSVLIPTFAKFKSNRLDLNRFIDSIWIIILGLGVLFTVIGLIVSLTSIDLFISKETTDLKKIAFQVSLMIWLGSGFMFVSSYLMAILNYNKQFFEVAWTSILPAFFMIIFVLLFNVKLGIRSISLGFCFALIFQFIILLKASKISFNLLGFNIKRIPYKKLLLKQSFLVTLSLFPFTIIAPIAFFWASKLEIGSISYLGYSQSFAGFLSVAVSMGIAVVSLPELADKFANEKGESSFLRFEKTLRYVLLIGMFAAGVLIALRIPILSLFYERGSFDANSVYNLSSVLPWYLFAAVFVGGLNLLRNLFYSKGEFKNIAILGLIIPIIFFVLAGLLKEEFSFVGIGIANTLTFAILFFTSVYLAKNKEANFLTMFFLYFFLRNFIAVAISISSVSIFSSFIFDVTSQLVSIIFCICIFLIIYILSSKFILKIKEIDEIGVIFMNALKSSKL
jgi:putative peptidoglycan lipid II flippase